MNKFILVGLILVAFSKSLFAQNKVVADKIIAQIGDNIILKSDVDNDILAVKYRAGGQALPPDMDCYSLQQQIVQKVLVLRAQRVDSLTVGDDEIENTYQQNLQLYLQRYGSREEVERAMGTTIEEYRREMYPLLREQILARREQGLIVQNVSVTPVEVQAYYNTIPKDSLAYFESQFTASQIVMYPIPNEQQVDNIKKQLQDYKQQVESGAANFAQLVVAYSDDPVARQNYGLMRINREDDKGRIDPDFLKAAFLLREKQISPIVKDEAGRYHLIQMVSRVGNDAQVRDLVKIPPISDIEIKATIGRMDTLHDLLADHKIEFGQAFALYNEDKDARYNGGAIVGNAGGYPVTPFSLDQLQDKELVNTLAKMKENGYSDPMTFQDQNQRIGVRIVYLKKRTQPHRENMADDYSTIEAKALQQKQQQVMESWIRAHIQDYYLRIDPSYGHCLELAKWSKDATQRIEHFSAGNVIK